MAGGWCRGQPTTVKLSYVGGIAQKFSRVRKMSSIVLRWQTPSPEFCFSRRQRMRRRLLRCSRTFRRPTPALFRAAYFRRRGVQRSEAIARFLKRERVSRDPKTGGKPPASMSETCSNGKTGQDATLAGADRPDDRAPPSSTPHSIRFRFSSNTVAFCGCGGAHALRALLHQFNDFP
jgi:hypothetical protein